MVSTIEFGNRSSGLFVDNDYHLKKFGQVSSTLSNYKKGKRVSFMVIRVQRWKNMEKNRDKFFSAIGISYFSMLCI